jgi:hypothetical protein
MYEYLLRLFPVINDPHKEPQERLAALREIPPRGPANTSGVNNHIHTVYSFSPYTPSMAALRAWDAGLEAAGSVDHDSTGAAEEMRAAAACLGIGCCCGFEARASFKTSQDGSPSPLRDRKINNPDSLGIGYMTVQGIPAPSLPQAQEFLAPIRAARFERICAMAARLSALLEDKGFPALDMQEDLLKMSLYPRGGTLTERHLLAAAARLFIRRLGPGAPLLQAIKTRFGLSLPPETEALLANEANPCYLFDLVGALKPTLLPQVFIQPAEDECIPAKTLTGFARAIGAVPAYAYLGDVGKSPTLDKAAEAFEDAYLDALFDELSALGFSAVTYMPPRNTRAQISRVQRLCAEKGFMEISGMDINSPRQPFSCPEAQLPDFRRLTDSTWALVAHERLASLEPRFGLFSPENPYAAAPLAKRLKLYAALGRELDRSRPEESACALARKLREGLPGIG